MIIITAYHGTSKKNAERILKEGFRIQRDNKQYPNDLGHGVYGYIDSEAQHGDVYFMRSAKENAALFARQIKKVPEDQVVVLKIMIECLEDEYANLNEVVNRNIIVKLHDKVIDVAIQEAFYRYQKNRASRRRQIDGVIFEHLIRNGILQLPSLIVIDSFTRFNGILSNFTNGREIVIRNLNVIKSVQVDK